MTWFRGASEVACEGLFGDVRMLEVCLLQTRFVVGNYDRLIRSDAMAKAFRGMRHSMYAVFIETSRSCKKYAGPDWFGCFRSAC